MSGRPDYDAGDLVVCVKVDDRKPPATLTLGRVYTVADVSPFGDRCIVRLVERAAPKPYTGYSAHLFRKLDPKPPEFWTQDIEADTQQKVTA
jgi:hypothetical protein